MPFGPRVSQTGVVDLEPPAPVRPDDFWGEDSASIHDVLQAPDAVEPTPIVVEVGAPPAPRARRPFSFPRARAFSRAMVCSWGATSPTPRRVRGRGGGRGARVLGGCARHAWSEPAERPTARSGESRPGRGTPEPRSAGYRFGYPLARPTASYRVATPSSHRSSQGARVCLECGLTGSERGTRCDARIELAARDRTRPTRVDHIDRPWCRCCVRRRRGQRRRNGGRPAGSRRSLRAGPSGMRRQCPTCNVTVKREARLSCFASPRALIVIDPERA